MKMLFTLNNVVIGHAVSNDIGVSVSSGITSVDYVVPDNSPVDVGWTVSLDSGVPTFSAPVNTTTVMKAVLWYNCFTPDEATAIKGSKDSNVKEFYFRLEQLIAAGEYVDTSINSIQNGIGYLSQTDQLPAVTPAAPYIDPSRVAPIIAGISQ